MKTESENQMELLVILSDGSMYKIGEFPFFAEKISESAIKEEKVPAILEGLILNGYVETRDNHYETYKKNDKSINNSFLMISKKGKEKITNFVFQNWGKTKTRWRRKLIKTPWIAHVAESEVKIVRMLLEKNFVEVNEELFSNINIDEINLNDILTRKMIEKKLIGDKRYIIRGSKFMQKCAEIIHSAEAQNNYSVGEEWRGAVEIFLNCIKRSEGERRRNLLNNKFQREIVRLKKIEVCPLGIPTECRTSWIHDEDSIFATERHITYNPGDCKIVIKPSSCREGEENLIFVEITQPITEVPEFLLKGGIEETIALFLSIVEEMEKMLKKDIVKGFKIRNPTLKYTIGRDQNKIEVTILNSSSTKNERVIRLTYNNIQRLLESVGS